MFKGKSKHYDVFVRDASEIAKKLHENDIVPSQRVVWKIMMNMVLPSDNMNYVATRKYMPDAFDKGLYDNNGGNSYDSEWMQHTDDKMNTVVNAGIKLACVGSTGSSAKVYAPANQED